jgi:hypothetical protein
VQFVCIKNFEMHEWYWHHLFLKFMTCEFKSPWLTNFMRNHVKLEIWSFVMNFNCRGLSLRVLYYEVNTGYGQISGGMHCRKIESTKWLKHKLRATIEEANSLTTNWWQIWVFFSFEVHQGMAGICHTGLWGFFKTL